MATILREISILENKIKLQSFKVKYSICTWELYRSVRFKTFSKTISHWYYLFPWTNAHRLIKTGEQYEHTRKVTVFWITNFEKKMPLMDLKQNENSLIHHFFYYLCWINCIQSLCVCLNLFNIFLKGSDFLIVLRSL